jgi:hypothetical protein
VICAADQTPGIVAIVPCIREQWFSLRIRGVIVAGRNARWTRGLCLGVCELPPCVAA